MADLLNEKDQLINLENMFREEKFPEALDLAQRLIKEFPESFQVEFMFARLLRANGKLEEAEAVLSRLVGSHDNHLNLLLEMGGLLMDLNKLDPSFDFYNRALFIDPFNRQAKEALKAIQQRFSSHGKGPAAPGRTAQADKKNWKADTLPEVDIGGAMEEGEDDVPDLQVEDQITADSIRIEDDSIREIKPSIPGVDEAYVPEEKVEVKTADKKVSPEVEESLTVDPDFASGEGDSHREEVTTDDVADLFAGEPDAARSDTPSTRRPVPEVAGDGAATGDEFVTESAAELYVSQGLYDEALFIYEKLDRLNHRDEYGDKIEELKSKSICQRKIQALTAFLNIIQKRGG